MFFNEQPFLENRNQVYDPGHDFVDYADGGNSTILFICFGFLLFFFGYQSIFLQKLGEFCKIFQILKTESGELIVDQRWNFLIDIDENLGSYWECLRGMDQKRWFAKEAHHVKNLSIRTVDVEAYEHLRCSRRAKKFIGNIYNYDILTNFRYADEFFYTQLSMREKGDEASDFVSRVIYLGEEKVTHHRDHSLDFLHMQKETPQTDAGGAMNSRFYQ